MSQKKNEIKKKGISSALLSQPRPCLLFVDVKGEHRVVKKARRWDAIIHIARFFFVYVDGAEELGNLPVVPLFDAGANPSVLFAACGHLSSESIYPPVCTVIDVDVKVYFLSGFQPRARARAKHCRRLTWILFCRVRVASEGMERRSV